MSILGDIGGWVGGLFTGRHDDAYQQQQGDYNNQYKDIQNQLLGPQNQNVKNFSAYAGASQNPQIQAIMQSYANGQVDLNTAIQRANSVVPGAGDAFASSPLVSSQMATDQALSNPTMQGLFGPGGQMAGAEATSGTYQQNYLNQLGAQDQSRDFINQAQQNLGGLYGNYQGDRGNLAGDQAMMGKQLGLANAAMGNVYDTQGLLDQDRNALMGRDQSYGLTQNDLAAYGQASGNIGRMYGGMEQGLAQDLADRGLAAGPSGASNALFSGMLGNKYEQLGQLQQQIATNRINTAQQLAQARAQNDLGRMGQANQLASTAGDIYGRSVGQYGQDVGLLNSDIGAIGEGNATMGQGISNLNANTAAANSAQNAVQNNQQYLLGLGQLGQSAINSQYNRNLQGAENNYNMGAGGINAQMQNTAQNLNALNSQAGANSAYENAYNQSYTPGILGAIGTGFTSGLTSGTSDLTQQAVSGGGKQGIKALGAGSILA